MTIGTILKINKGFRDSIFFESPEIFTWWYSMGEWRNWYVDPAFVAGMLELVDRTDLKSVEQKLVRVRPPLPA